jgi:hypothetical protein
MSEVSSIFSPQVTEKVTLGGQEYVIGQFRTVDLPMVGELIEQLKEKSLENYISVTRVGKDFTVNFNQIVENLKNQPERVCSFLAAIIDPDPFSSESTDFRAKKTREFLLLPITEISTAIGKVIEVNASFFAQMVVPMILGATRVLKELQTLIENQQNLNSI